MFETNAEGGTTNLVERGGQNLGEIQANLLKQVEELTLYMIALSKENAGPRFTSKK